MSMNSGEIDKRFEVLMRRIEQLEVDMRRLKLREAERARQEAQQERQRDTQRERESEKQSDNAKPSYYITIEHLQMEQPVLEQLAFRLDSLDIKELSGSLNLGNNFGSAEAIKLPGLDGSGVRDAQAGQEQSARKEAAGKKAAGKDETQEDAGGKKVNRGNEAQEKHSAHATRKETAHKETTWENTTWKEAAQEEISRKKYTARDTPAVASSMVNASSSSAEMKGSAEQSNAQGYPPFASAPTTPVSVIPTGFNEPVRAAVWHTPVEGQEMKPVGINMKASSSELPPAVEQPPLFRRDVPPKEAGTVDKGPRINLNSHRGE